MNKSTLLVGFLILVSWSGTFPAYAGSPLPVPVFIELNASDLPSMERAIAQVEAHGGICIHRFPFKGCIGQLPEGEGKALLAQAEVVGVHYGAVNQEELAYPDESLELALHVWDQVFVHPPAEMSVSGAEEPLPPPDDALLPPDLPPLYPPVDGGTADLPSARERTEGGDVSGAGVVSQSPGYYQTSEFMVGSVTIGIVMPESDGSIDSSSEDWSVARQDAVVAEIVAAGNWWASREPAANLSFTYQVERSAPTGYEPVTRSQSSEGLWISQVMGQLGYPGTSYWTQTRDYVNGLRAMYGTDWAFAAFVVDDLNDVDNKFAANANGNKYFAYAYLGGPFLVMTYDNNGYGNANMDAVMAHEMGHIFLALDGYQGSSSCTAYSGYLYIQNTNSVEPSTKTCGAGVPCIMRGQVSPYTNGAISPSARQQIGWRDSDNDGLLDPVDTDVGLSVWTSSSQSQPAGISWTLAGLAFDYPWDSLTRTDVTINTVTAVQYRIDGGAWRQASPDDGNWDEPVEAFTFATGLLSEDSHTVTVRAYNSESNTFSYDMQVNPPQPSQVFLPLVIK